jgi:uncharacterized hydrophobic protein (TIGR00271 family)
MAEILRTGWRSCTGDWSPFVEDALPAADLTSAMHQASVPSFGYFFMLGLASAIATFGLLSDSAPAIIGAMIIAPLMAPIMSLTFGVVVFDRQMILRSVLSIVSGVILVVVFAYASITLLGLRIAGTEILSRTSPTLIDLGIAMAAGGAAAFAYTRRSIMTSIAGVAIAVALVPPLAVTGIGLALGRETTGEAALSLMEIGLVSGGVSIAHGAFLLFLTNLIGIVAVGIAVFAAHRYGHWKAVSVGLVLAVLSSAFLIEPLGESFRRLYVKSTTFRLVATLTTKRSDIFSAETKIDSVFVTYRDDQLYVDIHSFAPTVTTAEFQKRAELFQQYLSAELKEPVHLQLQVIPVDMLRFKVGPSTAESVATETRNKDGEGDPEPTAVKTPD